MGDSEPGNLENMGRQAGRIELYEILRPLPGVGRQLRIEQIGHLKVLFRTNPEHFQGDIQMSHLRPSPIHIDHDNQLIGPIKVLLYPSEQIFVIGINECQVCGALQAAVAVAGEYSLHQQQEQKNAQHPASNDDHGGEKCPGMAGEPATDTADTAQHDCCDNSEHCTMQCPMANCGHCLTPGQGGLLNSAMAERHLTHETLAHVSRRYQSQPVITPTPPPNTFL